MNALKKFRLLAIVLSLVVLALAVLLLHPAVTPYVEKYFGKGELTPVQFETLNLSSKYDKYLVCSPDFCASTRPHMVAPVYKAPHRVVRERLLASIDQDPTYFRRNLDLSKQQFEFTQRVPNSPYPDVITIRFIDLGENRSTLAIFSRTVAGRSEMGRNRARVERLLSVIEDLRIP